jgi:DNA modification methylase
MVLSPEDQKRREIAAAKRSLGPGILGQVINVPIDQLVPYEQNARTHSDEQLAVIGQSIQGFGWMNTVLVDDNNVIIAGHGRVEAAKRIGLTHAPVIRVSGLTPDQLRAYRLADNRIAEIAGWDEAILAIELQHISEIDIGCSIETLGWKPAEVEILLETHVNSKAAADDRADDLPKAAEVAVSRTGDLWLCGDHRVLCGSAVDPEALARLVEGNKAQLVCQDPPWNIAVKSVVGSGKTKHREFVMGSGEMSDPEFRDFVRQEIRCNAEQAVAGAVLQVFIDWRGIEKVIAAGEAEGLELLNVLVWVKSNGGMSGGPWRSQHELIVVFRKPGAKIKNRVELGKYGRYRTNVLQVPGLNSFGKGRMDALQSHPTRKPVELIAELIRDVTDIGDIVLDSFLGSGTALIAAERTRRICHGMELDPLYVDTAVRRWEQFTGKNAILEESGRTFAEIEVERSETPSATTSPLPAVRTRTRKAA